MVNEGKNIFISHSHQDDRMAATLAWDLLTAGAPVWVGMEDIHANDIALEKSEWVVLLVTDASLESPAVRDEVDVAKALMWNGQMKGVIAMIGKEYDEEKMPATWQTLQRYNAVEEGYKQAFQRLTQALGYGGAEPQTIREQGSSPNRIPEAEDRVFAEYQQLNREQEQHRETQVQSELETAQQETRRRRELARRVIEKGKAVRWQTLVTLEERAMGMSGSKAWLWRIAGRMRYEAGDMAGAEQAWKQAFMRAQTAEEIKEIEEEKYAEEMKQKEYGRAEQTVKQALEYEPESAEWQRKAEAARIAEEKRQRKAQEILRQLGYEGKKQNSVSYIISPVAPIPDGEFLMGSDKNMDKDAQENEFPQHRVWLDGYEIGKYPVTVAEYALFVEATHHVAPRNWEEQKNRLEHPIVSVNWYDAQAYAKWLSEVTGEQWRLPSEAEWEKAARGTDGRIYPWGNEWDASKANTADAGPGTTTPVGRYPQGASPYGVMDMTGNVWEWTHTRPSVYPYDAEDGREDEELLISSLYHRVMRGGAWNYFARDVRVASRYTAGREHSSSRWGFRLVRV